MSMLFLYRFCILVFYIGLLFWLCSLNHLKYIEVNYHSLKCSAFFEPKWYVSIYVKQQFQFKVIFGLCYSCNILSLFYQFYKQTFSHNAVLLWFWHWVLLKRGKIFQCLGHEGCRIYQTQMKAIIPLHREWNTDQRSCKIKQSNSTSLS